MIRVLALFCSLALAVVFFNANTTRKVRASNDVVQQQSFAQSFKAMATNALRLDILDMTLISGAPLAAGNAASSPMAGPFLSTTQVPALMEDLWLYTAEQHSTQAANLSAGLTLCLYNGSTVFVRQPNKSTTSYVTSAATQMTATGKTAYANLAGNFTEGEPLLALVRTRGTTAAESCDLSGLVKTAKNGVTMDPDRVVSWVSYPEVQAGLSDNAGLRPPVRARADLEALKPSLLRDNEIRLVRTENLLYSWSARTMSWSPVELAAAPAVLANPTSCSRPGFLFIPASVLEDGTPVPSFCVSRGEMNVAPIRQDDDNVWCYTGRNNARQNATPAEGVFGAEPSIGGCFDSASSTIMHYEWASYSYAKSACLAYGYRLLTSAQWQAIANNIAAQPSNWTGSTGAFVFKNGRQGTSAATVTIKNSLRDAPVLTIPGVDQNPYPGTSSITDSQEAGRYRTHLLSTGFWIADFSGNLAEWVDDEVADYDQQQITASALRTQSNSDTRVKVADFTMGTGNVWSALPASIRPPASVLAKGNGQSQAMNLGSFVDGVFSGGPADSLATASPNATVWRAALRGGGKVWLPSANAAISLEPGLYSYHRFAVTKPASAVSTRGVLAGYRCTTSPQ